jgi:hypothetical protein
MNAKRFSIIVAFALLAMLLTACGAKTVTQVVEKVVRETQVVKVVETNEVAAVGETALLNYSTGVRMVIKDAEIEVIVQDTDAAIEIVTKMAADYGGYILSSQSWVKDDAKYATIRLATPSASFENVLNNLRHLGVSVVRETASGQDVSAEYTDLGTRLTNLEATAARVREFLKAAQTVEESLKVSQALSELEGQIEQIKGQMKYYEGRTAFSTVTVTLTPEYLIPTPEPKAGWKPGETFHSASRSFVTIITALGNLIIWLVVVFGPFALLGFLSLWIVLRLTKIRK